jgi:hypothetical protein
MIVGAVVASIATAVFMKTDGADGLLSIATGQRESGPDGPSIQVPTTLDEQKAAFERYSREDDPLELEELIVDIAARQPSYVRDAELNASLSRLAAIDPRRAVALAQELALGEEVIAGLFRAWASADPDAALAALGALQPSIEKRAAALAVVAALGAWDGGLDRVADSLPLEESLNLRVEAIGMLAERDLIGALAAASSPGLPQETQSRAQQRIAETMAYIDPVAAFEQARTIALPKLRTRYLERLVNEWAKVDPEAVLSYLESADIPEISLSAASFHALAASGPERLLALAERLPPRSRTNAQEVALQELASLDPVSAYARISSLPPTGDIDRLVTNIADRYASQSPEAAIAWATSLEPRSDAALTGVLARIAATDPLLAANTVIAEILDPVAANRADIPSIMSVLSGSIGAGSPQVAQVADLLASHGDPRVGLQLNQMLQLWSQADPAAALDWVANNSSRLTASSATGLAQQLGSQAPELARQSLQRIRPDLQSVWLEGVAAGMAQSDVDAALSWIENHRNEPGYERARAAALRSGVNDDPATVARLIEDDPELRSQMTPLVVNAWASRDRDAAERWVLDQPQGGDRDGGIQALLQNAAAQGDFDRELFDRLSTPAMREQALMSMLFILGSSNPALGRQLIQERISDPEQRRVAEARLESGSNLPAGITGIRLIQ